MSTSKQVQFLALLSGLRIQHCHIFHCVYISNCTLVCWWSTFLFSYVKELLSHIYTFPIEYYPGIKQEWNFAISNKMHGLEVHFPTMLSEIRQKTNIVWHHLYVESKKIIQMSAYTKQKQTHKHKKQIYSYQEGQIRSMVLTDTN